MGEYKLNCAQSVLRIIVPEPKYLYPYLALHDAPTQSLWADLLVEATYFLGIPQQRTVIHLTTNKAIVERHHHGCRRHS